MRTLALALVLLTASLPARAVVECDNDAALLQAIDEAAKLYLKDNRCISGMALMQWSAVYPKGVSKELVEQLRAATYDGAGKDPGKLAEIRKKKAEAAAEAAAAPVKKNKKGVPQPSPPPAEAAPEEMVPLDADIIQMAAIQIHNALKAGKIKAKCDAGLSAAADWGHDPNCGIDSALCGEMSFNRTAVEDIKNKLADTSDNVMFVQDQLANSIVHETGHAFVSFFRNVLGAEQEGQCALGKNDIEFHQTKHWNGCPDERGGYALTRAGYAVSACNEKTARQIAHRLNSCGRFAGVILGVEPPPGGMCSVPGKAREITFTAPKF